MMERILLTLDGYVAAVLAKGITLLGVKASGHWDPTTDFY